MDVAGNWGMNALWLWGVNSSVNFWESFRRPFCAVGIVPGPTSPWRDLLPNEAHQ